MGHGLVHPTLARLLAREDIEQLTPKWFEWRGRMITASQVASITGECPYKSAVQLLKEKVWPELRQDSATFATRHGNQYEDDAVLKYEKTTGKRVLRIGLLQHEKYEWIGASPDGVAAGTAEEEPIAIEVCVLALRSVAMYERHRHSRKTAQVKCPVSREITKDVPGHYRPQVQLQLEVMDLEEADFVQFRPATLWTEEEFVITRVKRDRDWWHRAYPLCRKFYQRWQELKASGAPPPPTIIRRAGLPREKTLNTEHTTLHACPFRPSSPREFEDQSLRLDRLATGACPFKL